MLQNYYRIIDKRAENIYTYRYKEFKQVWKNGGQ